MVGVGAVSDDGNDVHALRVQIRALRDRAPAVLPVGDLREVTEQRLRDLMLRAARLERGDVPAREPDPPGRFLWGPHPDIPCFLVVRRFTLGGKRVEPGEIVVPTTGYWQGRHTPVTAIDGGWLKPLTEYVLSWACPEDRFFATRELLAQHDCAELAPSDDVPATSSGPDHGELPPELKGQHAVYARHWRSGKRTGEIAELMGVGVRSTEKMIVALRKKFGPSVIPYRRPPPGH